MIELDTSVIERNRKDFEDHLRKLEDSLPTLKDVLAEDLVYILEGLISEYDFHLQSNIDDLLEAYEDYERTFG